MRSATVRDLRNHDTRLLGWISAGGEIVITFGADQKRLAEIGGLTVFI